MNRLLQPPGLPRPKGCANGVAVRGTTVFAAGRAFRDDFGRNFPAMAVVEATALVEDRAKIEIETTAVVPD